MGSHASALAINAYAYAYARRDAADARFSFGTGKVNALGGYTGAVLLGGFALAMLWESASRFLAPVEIAFDWALAVAVVGLAVNGVSAFLLAAGRPAGHADQHHHDESPSGTHHHHHHHEHDGHDHAHDLNLRSAYFHVLADALTSLLAIAALLAGKFLGAWWMDPLMGIVGAVLVTRWSWSLLRDSSGILLDRQAPEAITVAIRDAIEGDTGDRLYELHVWSLAPSAYAAVLGVVTDAPRLPGHYKGLLPSDLGLVHVTVEVEECRSEVLVAA